MYVGFCHTRVKDEDSILKDKIFEFTVIITHMAPSQDFPNKTIAPSSSLIDG